MKPGRDSERVLATNRDQGVHTKRMQVLPDPRDTAVDPERVGP
jgi:hypothetical protein